MPATRSKTVKRPICCDTKNPGGKRAALERRERSPRRQERVLHHILGVGLTDHPHRMPIERPFDVSSELLEGARVAPTGPLHKQSARLDRKSTRLNSSH